MANEKNLIPGAHELTVEEQSRGGKKSGNVRRRKATMKATMKQLLTLPVQDTEIWNTLSAMGIAPEQMDNQTALLAAVLAKGIRTGDYAAMKAVLSLIGEDNEAELLKLKKQELKLKERKQESTGTDGKLTELIEGLKNDIHE